MKRDILHLISVFLWICYNLADYYLQFYNQVQKKQNFTPEMLLFLLKRIQLNFVGNSTNLVSKLAEGSDKLHTRIPLGFWGIIYMQSEKNIQETELSFVWSIRSKRYFIYLITPVKPVCLLSYGGPVIALYTIKLAICKSAKFTLTWQKH